MTGMTTVSTPIVMCARIGRTALSIGAVALMSACTTRDATPADSTAVTMGTAAAAEPRPAPAPSSDAAWQLSPEGVRDVRVGMTSAQARTALGLPSAPPFAAGTCEYLDAASLPVKLYFMLESDTLVRIDARDSTVTTPEGARVGDTEARIKELYGASAVVTPHKYTGPVGHYLTVTPAGDSTRRIVFETDGQRVTMFRAGRMPAVEYVEGCF